MDRDQRRDQQFWDRAWRGQLGLALVFGLALVTRSLGFERVFPDEGPVVFAAGDAYYHVRRALFGVVHFPSVLLFDSCINWPEGARVPHPPGYSWLIGAIARLVATTETERQTVLAWLPVGFGALAVFPVHALGRALRGRGVGLAAAFLYATLPVAIGYSTVGNPDHHAAAALLGACLIWLYVEMLDPRCRGSRLWGVAAGLALTRVALMTTWHGSALYLPLGEAALILACVARDRRDGLWAQSASVLASAVCILPLVLLAPTPAAGIWSATELSGLHVLGLVALAALCLGALGLQRVWPRPSASPRVLRIAGVALALGCLALVFSGIRDGLIPALEFVSKSDDWGNTVLEQMPLFFLQGELRSLGGIRHLGYYAFLLPLVPIAFALLDSRPELRAGALFLFAWSFLLAGLSLYQVRFANDFAPVACVGFALLLVQLTEGLARPPSFLQPVLSRPLISMNMARGLAVASGIALVAPSFFLSLGPGARASLSQLVNGSASVDRALQSIAGTQVRFAERVLAVTPAQPGCQPDDAPGTRPDYGILAHPALGHVLHLVAQRATPADPFGPYIGDPNYRKVMDFLAAETEAEALALAAELQTPYVATAADADESDDFPMMRRLHREDGSATAESGHLERFRLVTEGPRGGIPISRLFAPGETETIPYKLFEVVSGAVIEFPAPPGELVEARLVVATRSRRRFVYRASAVASAQGRARIRVPYATGARGDVSTSERYELRAGSRRGLARVPEQAVQKGLVVLAEVATAAASEASSAPGLQRAQRAGRGGPDRRP